MDKSKKMPPAAFESDGENFFVIFKGVKIAKRGLRGTVHAKTWISLEPGYKVTDRTDADGIIIEHDGVRVH